MALFRQWTRLHFCPNPLFTKFLLKLKRSYSKILARKPLNGDLPLIESAGLPLLLFEGNYKEEEQCNTHFKLTTIRNPCP